MPITASEARKGLFPLIKQVNDDHDAATAPVTATRPRSPGRHRPAPDGHHRTGSRSPPSEEPASPPANPDELRADALSLLTLPRGV
jgi:hypothetical protein